MGGGGKRKVVGERERKKKKKKAFAPSFSLSMGERDQGEEKGTPHSQITHKL